MIHNLQSPSGEPFAIITSVEQVGGTLYLGSLEEPALPEGSTGARYERSHGPTSFPGYRQTPLEGRRGAG